MLPAGGPQPSVSSLCSRSVQRWGQKSSVLFFSRHLELTRVPSGPCTPRASCGRGSRCQDHQRAQSRLLPGQMARCDCSSWWFNEKRFFRQKPEQVVSALFSTIVSMCFLEILSQLKHTCLVPLPPPKLMQTLRTRSQLGGLLCLSDPDARPEARLCGRSPGPQRCTWWYSLRRQELDEIKLRSKALWLRG